MPKPTIEEVIDPEIIMLNITDPDPVPVEWLWERLRLQRDRLLAATDHRMVADAPWNVEPWADYRQALRDLPEATTDPSEVVWPEPPTG
jgi:hypothetical protein